MGRPSQYYVPGYLSNVERQFDGWPVWVKDEEKEPLTKAAREVLDMFPDGVSLDRVYCLIERNHKFDALKACLWDALYAVVHRALLNAEADEVWVISKEKRESEARHKAEMEKAIPYNKGLFFMPAEESCRDDGKAYWYMGMDLVSLFPDLFEGCQSNYDARDMLLEAKVLRKNNNEDVESSCFQIDFSTEKAGENFIERFNKWAAKKRGK